MGVMHRLVDRNEEFVSKFRHGDRTGAPAQHLALLTCMDARIHLAPALGLDIGDANIIRNAGGRASDDAIRSLVISTELLGTNEIAVMHHTDCGMLKFTNDDSVPSCRPRAGSTRPASTSFPSQRSSRACATTLRRSRRRPWWPTASR